METFNLAAFTIDQGDDPRALHDSHALEYGFNNTPKLNFGAAKLIARYQQLLLTLPGSDRTDPNAGGDLLLMLGRLHTSETGYIRNEVAQILQEVTFQAKQANDPDASAESRLANAECENIEILEDEIRISIRLTTEANTHLRFELPIAAV